VQKITVRRKINAPLDEVRGALWRIKDWAQFWAPLHKVEIFYDDGVHQDFTMFLEWQAVDTHVRTVRFLDAKGNISFFSPTPPLLMSVHQGVWELSSDQGYTELAAVRYFELPYQEKETTEEYNCRLGIFSKGFEERLTSLLERLGELCEK